MKPFSTFSIRKGNRKGWDMPNHTRTGLKISGDRSCGQTWNFWFKFHHQWKKSGEMYSCLKSKAICKTQWQLCHGLGCNSARGVGDCVKIGWIRNTERYGEVLIHHAKPSGKQNYSKSLENCSYLKKLHKSLARRVHGVLKNKSGHHYQYLTWDMDLKLV